MRVPSVVLEGRAAGALREGNTRFYATENRRRICISIGLKLRLTPTHNQHKERDSVWRILGGWWQGDWTAPEFELEKSDTAGHGNKWRFIPLPDGGTPGGLPPAGRGNADIGMWRFAPCRTGERRAVYPLPDGGTPNAMWRFTPCRTGERRFGMWRFTPPPLPDGGTLIWNVAVYPPAGRGHADLDCGGLRRLW